jgi:nucleoside-diphosphate-sugar epimerase
VVTKESILVTGATGFIGSHTVEALLSKVSHSIVAIVRKSRNYKNVEILKHRGVVLVEGEFYDPTLLERIFQEHRIDHVIHIAALRGAGIAGEEMLHKVNVLGTQALLEQSMRRHVKKFIFCSSVGVLGTIPQNLPGDLKSEMHGDNPYHRSKILAEEKVQDFISRGLNAFIVRPTITYGERDSGFPSKLVGLVRKGRLPLPFKDNKIHLLDVNRLVEAFLRILSGESPMPRIFLIADESPLSMRELTDLIYHHYHGQCYPSFLRAPNFVYDFLLLLFKMLGSEKWSTRMLLLTRDWYYDSVGSSVALNLGSSDTLHGFSKYLATLP